MDPTQSELEEKSVKEVDTTRGSNPGSSAKKKLVDLTTDMRLKADFIGTTSGRYLPTPNAAPPLTLRPTYLPSVLSGPTYYEKE